LGVAVAFDVDEAAAQFGFGAFAVPGGFFAEGFEDSAAVGVSVRIRQLTPRVPW
jgi:hypothetical protein